jgi:hypothetical protein
MRELMPCATDKLKKKGRCDEYYSHGLCWNLVESCSFCEHAPLDETAKLLVHIN